MNQNIRDSIVLITSSDAEFIGSFGTGFIIHHDERTSYVLTCAHVVEEVGGSGKVRVGGHLASEVALGDRSGCDLAVLAVEDGLVQLSPLRLGIFGDKGREFIISGCYADSTKTFKLADINGKLGGIQTILSAEGDRTPAWNLEISNDSEHDLKSGYSGSPVVDKGSGYVVGVVAQLTGQRKGLAISIEALKKIWNLLPNDLFLDSKVANSSPPPKEFVEIKYIVECIVQNYSRLIPVENTLQMSLQDVSRYSSAHSPNLQAWVESAVEKNIKPLLISKKYIDVLTNFQTVSNTIYSEISKAAESIGYKLENIVSIPMLVHLDLKKDFKIEINNEEFLTKTNSVSVKLTIIVNARFDNFNQIEQYLDRGVDEIIEEMQKIVNTETRKVLQQIDLERFYLHFYADKTEGEKSVEKELQQIITKALEERFGVEVTTVVPIPEETYIIEYLQRLTGMIGKFECEINSTSGSQPVKFKGEFKIEGIGEGSWHRFQTVFLSRQQSQQRLWQELDVLNAEHSKIISLGDIQGSRSEIDRINQRIIDIENDIFGLDEIQGCIQKSLESNLRNIHDISALSLASFKDNDVRDKVINQLVITNVSELYGLQIKLLNIRFDRMIDKSEKHQDIFIKEKTTRIKQDIEMLIKEYHSLTENIEAVKYDLILLIDPLHIKKQKVRIERLTEERSQVELELNQLQMELNDLLK